VKQRSRQIPEETHGLGSRITTGFLFYMYLKDLIISILQLYVDLENKRKSRKGITEKVRLQSVSMLWITMCAKGLKGCKKPYKPSHKSFGKIL